MKCYCCKANTEQLDLVFENKPVPKAYGCRKCGHIFTGCPDDFNLEDFYCNEYRSENKNAFYEETVREKYEKGILAQLKSEVPDFKPNSILEVGAGIGYLLQRTLKDFNLSPESATTCELNKNHAEDLGRQGFNSIFGDFISVDFKRRFDLFIAIDIIEHIEDVSVLPQKIKQLISKDGLGLIQVPARRLIKPFAEHFHYFNPHSFFELFKNTFEIVSVFENDFRETSNGPALLGIIKN
tara:strand:- start:2884 stop:3600 length:717 start_codon:yes stop_codon:yes gene_type:complete